MSMNHTYPQMLIRLPAELKERIRESAVSNRRSMTSEIVYTLEQALPAEEIETGVTPGSTTPVSVNRNQKETRNDHRS